MEHIFLWRKYLSAMAQNVASNGAKQKDKTPKQARLIDN